MPPDNRPQRVMVAASEGTSTSANVSKTIEAIRSQLKLPAEMSAQEVIDAAMERIEAMDRQTVDSARRFAAAGRASEAPPPSRPCRPEVLLDWAEATGRIAAASRPHWERTLAASREHTDALIRVLAPTPTVQASAPQVRAAWSPQTASGLDVSRLPARLQAAAAAEADRGKVYRWVERYGGMSDAEVAPLGLRLEGEDELAADVERRENEARIEARAAQDAEFERANADYQRVIAAEQDRRRQEAFSRYSEGT